MTGAAAGAGGVGAGAVAAAGAGGAAGSGAVWASAAPSKAQLRAAALVKRSGFRERRVMASL
ncbi:hypothetical protein EHF33_12640 [Deinococcus psychrotolerans]|uniref:Uncharacterized protein n=1 Tax=Deinococcus psychrotolerans TaxID=2489213 RepID=A0A3G8YLJ3_9DEIO|nr:hypothetical protein EHF33_12640 [Deinococcus psychrotolerans]